MEWPGVGILFSHIRELFLEWEELPPVLRWFGTGIIIIFIEYRFPSLLIIWFALAAFITSLLALFLPDLPLLHMTIFLVSTVIFFSYRRTIINILSPKDVLGFFTHEFIGKKVVCSNQIDPNKVDGLIKMSGIEWIALSLDSNIEKNEMALIVGRKNHILFVEPWNHELAVKVRKHRHMLRKSFPITITPDQKSGILIGEKTYAAKTTTNGRKIMKGELVEILAIGQRNVIVDLKDKDFLLPRDMIGKAGTAEEDFGVEKNIGSVKIEGVIWRSESTSNRSIKKGEKIRVVSIDGLTLSVETVEERTQTNNRVS